MDIFESHDLIEGTRGKKLLEVDLSQIHIDQTRLNIFLGRLLGHNNGFDSKDQHVYLELRYKDLKLKINFQASKIYTLDEFKEEWPYLQLDLIPNNTLVLKVRLNSEEYYIYLHELDVFKCVIDNKVRTPNVALSYLEYLGVKYIDISEVREAHEKYIKELRLDELKAVYDRLISQLKELEKLSILTSADFMQFSDEEPELFNTYLLDWEENYNNLSYEFYLPVLKGFKVSNNTKIDELLLKKIVDKYKLKTNDKELENALGFISFDFGSVDSWDKSKIFDKVHLTLDSSIDQDTIKKFYGLILEKLQTLEQVKGYSISFSLNVFPEEKKYERVQKAIDSIERGDVVNEYLVKNILSPETINFSMSISPLNFDIKLRNVDGVNSAQQIAIEKMLNMNKESNPFMFVQGPPGTGKTTVIAKLIEQLYLDGKNVLVTSNTHVAIDNVVDRVRGDKNLMVHRFTTLDTSKDKFDDEIIKNKINYFWNQVFSYFTVQDDYGKLYDFESIDVLYQQIDLESKKFDIELSIENEKLTDFESQLTKKINEQKEILSAKKRLDLVDKNLSIMNQTLDLKLALVKNIENTIHDAGYLQKSGHKKIDVKIDELSKLIYQLDEHNKINAQDFESQLLQLVVNEVEEANSFFHDIKILREFQPRDFFDWHQKIKKFSNKIYTDIFNQAVWLGKNYDNSLLGLFKQIFGFKNQKGLTKEEYNSKYNQFKKKLSKINLDFLISVINENTSTMVVDYVNKVNKLSMNRFIKDTEIENEFKYNNELLKFESIRDLKAEKRKYRKVESDLESAIENIEFEQQNLISSIESITLKKNQFLSKYNKLERLTKSAENYGVDFELIIDYLKEIKTIKKELPFAEKILKLDAVPKKSFNINNDGDSNLIIAMTTNQVAQIFKKNSNIKFDYTIVDEASKCTLEDVLVSLPNSENMVILGDVLQLVPEKQDHILLDDDDNLLLKRINQSILDRFYTQFKTEKNDFSTHERYQSIALLTEQYRMDQPIFDLIKRIYEDEKIHLTNSKPITDDILDSVFMVNTRSNSFTSTKGQLTNQEELEFIEKFLDKLTEVDVRERLIKENITIGIISYYRAQANEIDALIRQRRKALREIEPRSGTVDRFQGMEFDIVIVSSVRRREQLDKVENKKAKNIGFLDVRHRINVSLSRARKKLVFLSDSDFINSLSSNDIRKPGDKDDIDEKKKNEIVVDVFKSLLPYQVNFDDTMLVDRILGK
jgi:superfamily I DNA and/or RNA helicase